MEELLFLLLIKLCRTNWYEVNLGPVGSFLLVHTGVPRRHDSPLISQWSERDEHMTGAGFHMSSQMPLQSFHWLCWVKKLGSVWQTELPLSTWRGRQLNAVWRHSGHCNALLSLGRPITTAWKIRFDYVRDRLRCHNGTNKSQRIPFVLSLSSSLCKYIQKWLTIMQPQQWQDTGYYLSFPMCMIDSIRFFAISKVRKSRVINFV